jgi:hypothetical protein
MEDGERAVPGVVVRQGLPLLRNLSFSPIDWSSSYMKRWPSGSTRVAGLAEA